MIKAGLLLFICASFTETLFEIWTLVLCVFFIIISLSTMTHLYRRCSKCGANQVSNPELRMHRFPALGKNNENVLQLMSWAMFCDPNKDWFDLEALGNLQKSCKVICSRHFDDSTYTSVAKIRLHKSALPCLDENKENLYVPHTGSSSSRSNPNVLGVHDQIMPEQPPVKVDQDVLETQAIVCSTSSNMDKKCTENLPAPKAGPSHDHNPNVLRKKAVSRQRQNLSVSERKLYNKCKYLMKKVAKLQSEKKKKKSMDVLQMIHGDEHVHKLLEKKISPSMALLLQGELQNGKRRQKGRRWNEKQKFLAMEIYKKSPRTYKLIRRLFCLPSPSTLRRLLGQLVLKPGINKIIFANMKKFVNKISDCDNTWILTFDEMSIMKNLAYNKKNDEIDGYQDHGEQGRSKVFASHALVFMLVGIRQNWKQPVAFYLSGDYVTADRLTVLIKEVLHECLKAGANVYATVCDMDGVNVRALENLGSTVDKPYFKYEEQEIITFPDPPHLLKCFRNLFMKYDVKLPIPVQSTTTESTTGTGVASWKHIIRFHELDMCNPHFVFAPKLSKRHLEPNGKEKMRVLLATQIFSHSVASGIYSKASSGELPAAAVATATFLSHFNNLFDLLNSDSQDLLDGKTFKTNLTKTSPHMEFFKKSKKLIQEIEFIGCRRRPPSQAGWLKLLNGYERLWDNLKKRDIQSISTKRINQDPLENCFGCIRANCGSNVNPTVAQFMGGLKTGLLTNLRNMIKTEKNCKDDDNVLVENFKYLFSKKTKKVVDPMPQPNPNVTGQSIEVNVSDEDIESSAETQACAYVCGFIFKKFMKDCINCKKAMLADKPSQIHQFTEFKEYTDGKHSLQYANHSFIACVENAAELINKYLQENSHQKNIKKNCTNILNDNNFNFLQVCPEHWPENVNIIKESVSIILIKRFCVLENRKFSSECAKKSLAKKIKILTHT